MVDQPGQESKIVVDSVRDSTMDLSEVGREGDRGGGETGEGGRQGRGGRPWWSSLGRRVRLSWIQ